MSKPNGHLVIATGGTGGHFYPAIAVAREFQSQGGLVTLLIAGQRIEQHIEEARREGFVAFECQASRLPRSPAAAVTFPFRMLIGTLRVKAALKQLGPNFVLGMGSFASFPPCLAAGLAGIRLFLHDGNAVVGRANRLLSRWATCIGLSLPLAPGQRARCRTWVTGMPVRDQILRAIAVPPERNSLIAEIGLDPDRKTVLAFGGSQGAAFINGLMAAAAPDLAGLPVQVIHLTGREDNRDLEAAYASASIPAVIKAYDRAIEKLYSCADLVICRAGGATIAELALFAKPAVLIPIPRSPYDHQRLNATVLAQADAALMLNQDETGPGDIVGISKSILNAPAVWKKRAANIRSFGCPRAAADIVEMIFSGASFSEPVSE